MRNPLILCAGRRLQVLQINKNYGSLTMNTITAVMQTLNEMRAALRCEAGRG
jgi:hypothetical protein